MKPPSESRLTACSEYAELTWNSVRWPACGPEADASLIVCAPAYAITAYVPAFINLLASTSSTRIHYFFKLFLFDIGRYFWAKSAICRLIACCIPSVVSMLFYFVLSTNWTVATYFSRNPKYNDYIQNVGLMYIIIKLFTQCSTACFPYWLTAWQTWTWGEQYSHCFLNCSSCKHKL